MKIAPNRSYMFSLESVAMTDIVLIMFIFFFISFSLIATFNPSKTQHIKVNLPQAKHTSEPDYKHEIVTITLSSEGPIYLEDQLLTLKEVQAALGAKVSDDPDLGVVVSVDRLVPFKKVVSVLDLLNGLGIERLNIAAQKQEK